MGQDGWAGQPPTGGRAGAAWGRLGGAPPPDPIVLRGLCVGRAAVPSVCLSVCGGGGQSRAGGASQLSL